jgi:hypothetical protein
VFYGKCRDGGYLPIRLIRLLCPARSLDAPEFPQQTLALKGVARFLQLSLEHAFTCNRHRFHLRSLGFTLPMFIAFKIRGGRNSGSKNPRASCTAGIPGEVRSETRECAVVDQAAPGQA